MQFRLAAALDSLFHVREKWRVGSVCLYGRGGSRPRAARFAFSLLLGFESPTPLSINSPVDVSCFMFCFFLQHLGDSKAGYEKMPRMPSISGRVC